VKAVLFAVSALSLLAACEEPLKQAQLLEEPRVLGVRVATGDDRSSLLPGEPALLQVLVAGPDGAVGGRMAYRWCEAAASVRGVPYCAAAPFAEDSVDLDGAPFEASLPATLEPDVRLALLGAVCLTGEPELGDDATGSRCSDATAPLDFSFDARAGGDDFENMNPELSALQVLVDGVPVPLDAVDASPTCDAAAPSVDTGATSDIVFELGDGARDDDAESLQLSHFATAGEYARTFSFVERGKALRAGVEWQAPAAETPVKHYVVVRDGRGGLSWATFSLCVR
jgi:hypothetical protein